MKQLFVLLFLVFPFIVSGQKDSVIYFGPNGTLEPGTKRVIKKEISYRNKKNLKIKTLNLENDTEVLLFTERIKIKKQTIQQIRINGKEFEEKIERKFEKQPDGTYIFVDYQNDKIKRTGTTISMIPLLFHGKVMEYYANGSRKSISVYEHNELVSNENWTKDGEKYIDNIFYSVEQVPGFNPGTDSLHSHVLSTFRESGIDLSQVEGRMTVGFVVLENGTISGLQIEQGIGRELNDLAFKALNTLPGKWQPAQLNGHDVRYYQLFPINFIYRQHDFHYLELRGSMLYYQIN